MTVEEVELVESQKEQCAHVRLVHSGSDPKHHGNTRTMFESPAQRVFLKLNTKLYLNSAKFFKISVVTNRFSI